MENLQEKRDVGIPRKKSKTFKRIRFEAVSEEAQNNSWISNKPAKYAKKYFGDKKLKDSITLNSPVPTNLPKAKTMDGCFVELLKDQEKKKEIALDETFKKLQTKILTIMGPLSKVWYTVEELVWGIPRNFMLTRCRNILINCTAN